MTPESLPILLILGPTAAGKSSLGLAVAEAVGAEIVSADSCAVYRGMDIGTDKPSAADRARVPHHLVDVADPRERFSAGEFARDAASAIVGIEARGRSALVVGGSHFYVAALLRGLFPAPPRDPEIRERYEAQWRRDAAAVFARLQQVDPLAAAQIGAGDRQRIFRALEVYEVTGRPISSHWKGALEAPPYRPLISVVYRDLDNLYARIDERVDRMFSTGLVEEVERLLDAGVPADAHALKAIGYRQVVDHLHGRCSISHAIADCKRSSRRFAKRQVAWLNGLGERAHRVPPVDGNGAARLIDLWRDHRGEGRG